MKENCVKIQTEYKKIVDNYLELKALLKSGGERKVLIRDCKKLRNGIEKSMQAVEEFLPGYFPPELKAAVEEVFHGEAMDKIRMPKPEELTDEYFERMYPENERQEDVARGLKSETHGWWKNKTSNFEPAEETKGQAYKRSMIGEAVRLGGKSLLTETIQKPKFRDDFPQYGTTKGIDVTKDPLLAIVKEVFGERAKRFNHRWDELTEKLLPAVKNKIAEKLKNKGLAVPEFGVILTPAVVSNLQMTYLRPENSRTDTAEWTSTILLKQDGSETDSCLWVGLSDHGGAAAVDGTPCGSKGIRLGFRLSVVFGKVK